MSENVSVLGAALTGADIAIELGAPIQDVKLRDIKLVKAEVDRISMDAVHQFQDLELELQILNEALALENPNEFKSIKGGLAQLTATIQPLVKTSPSQNRTLLFMKANDACEKFIKDVTDITKRLKEEDSNPKIVKAMTRTTNFMKFGQTGVQIFQQLFGDYEKLKAMDDLIAQIDEQLRTIRQHRMNIFYIMMPQFELLSQSVDSIPTNLEGKSQPELIYNQLSMKRVFDHIYREFDKLSAHSALNGDIKNCFREISSAMDTIVKFYEKIDDYKAVKKMAEFHAAIARIHIDDGVAAVNVPNLPLIRDLIMKINVNVVIQQYETAMVTIKQRKFPFAKDYVTDDSNLYSGLSDLPIVNAVITKVANLIQKLRTEKNSFHYREKWHDNYDFVQLQSFYRWDYGGKNDDIQNLFNGDAVLLNADIKKAHLTIGSAFKFRRIWIRFVLKDPSKQDQFDEILTKFMIHMEMVENDHYQCNNRIYDINFESKKEFEYQMGKNGQFNRDVDFERLTTVEPFRSPYTTWRIYITSMEGNVNDFDLIKPFANRVSEILLEGNGGYLNDDSVIRRRYCTDELDKYYHLTDNK